MAGAERGQPGTWQFLAQWRNGVLDLDATLATLPCSDRDMTRLFLDCWPNQVFHEPASSGRRQARWLLWDGTCQRPDSSSQISRWFDLWTRLIDKLFDACRQELNAVTALRMAGQPEAAIEAEQKRAWQEDWVKSPGWKYAHGLRGITGVRNLMASVAGIAGTDTNDTSDWPVHPLLLNTANCVVSLDPATTGWEWREHDPGLRMTYCLSTPWHPAPAGDPLAGCPQFAALLWRAVGGDADVYWYLLYALGYSLCGSNRAQVIFFLSGPPASGKSQLLEAVSTVLESLAHEAMPELVTRPGRNGRHGRHNASIRGRRFVTIGETNDQLHLDENQIKLLTGQSRQTVDVLYETELAGAIITALLFIGNNQMPDIAHIDAGLVRRLKVIPMGDSIPVEQQISGIGEQIGTEEAEGILAALVWACRQVVASDYRLLRMPPPAVVAASEKYQRDQNTILLWMADNTYSANGQSLRQRGSDVRRDYLDWCGRNDKIPVNLHPFYDELSKVSGVVRSGSTDQAWFYGFVLKRTPED